MLIYSKDPVIQARLQRIADTVTLEGGEIHPELSIHQDQEKLWITCPPSADGQTLLMIPNELFIPVTNLEWIERDGLLAFEGSTESLSAVQKQLLDDMLVIYNATDKIQQVARQFPSQQLPGDPELLACIQSAHPAFTLSTRSLARQFIETRLNDQPAPNHPEQRISYLMPLIDLLNHHPYGSKYLRTNSGGWRIVVSHPVPECDMCFLRYTKTDSLSIAMWHNYFDPYTRHLASVDCTLQHNELGEVRIRGTNASRRNLNAPRLLPEEPVLTLQDLVLEFEQLPALRTLLGLAVRSKRRDLSQAQAEQLANELIALLVHANVEKYQELQRVCAKNSDNFQMRPLFGQVAKHQLRLLSEFRF